ncbi:MAG TPA: hypothetical protein VI322_02685 [Candidatus Saccharimonadia bacterium]
MKLSPDITAVLVWLAVNIAFVVAVWYVPANVVAVRTAVAVIQFGLLSVLAFTAGRMAWRAL